MNPWAIALRMLGGQVAVSHGQASVTCRGYVRELPAERRANDADLAPAVFVLEYEPLKDVGVHKFDRINVYGKVYTVIEARTMAHGDDQLLFKGTAAA